MKVYIVVETGPGGSKFICNKWNDDTRGADQVHFSEKFAREFFDELECSIGFSYQLHELEI